MSGVPRSIATEGRTGCGKARVPLTCGEFVQGNLAGLDFLVSCPVSLFSRAEVWLQDSEGSFPITAGPWPPSPGLPEFEDSFVVSDPASGPGPEIRVLAPPPPGGALKAARALKLTLREFRWNGRGAWLKIRRPVPPGKGYGSSTADIAATAFAAARALGKSITPRQVARTALSIEPTDGTMFPGLALFDHRRGRIARLLGPPPPMRILILDLGGEVDTGGFNRRADLAALNARKEPLVRDALRRVILGIRRGDPWLLGEGATGSAIAHQAILPKDGLEEIVVTARRAGAYGVVAAHSGTLLGLLLPLEEEVRLRAEESVSSFGYVKPAGLVAVAGGGEASEESIKTGSDRTTEKEAAADEGCGAQ